MSDSGRTLGDQDEPTPGGWAVGSDNTGLWHITTEDSKMLVAGMIYRETDARLMAAAKQTLVRLQATEAILKRLVASYGGEDCIYDLAREARQYLEGKE